MQNGKVKGAISYGIKNGQRPPEALVMPIVSAAILKAWRGMILQIVLIPTLLIILQKTKIIPLKKS